MTEYLLRGVVAFLFFGLIIRVAYVEIFVIPRERKRKTEERLARIKAQAEGVEKMCDADKRLRKLMGRKTPLHPEDPEMQEILWMLAEGEKQFRENSGSPTGNTEER